LLKVNLRQDQQRYTGPTSGPTKLSTRTPIPAWQRDHAKAVNDMSEYIVEANIDEDPDEDDSRETSQGSDPQASPRVEPGPEGSRERASAGVSAGHGVDCESRQPSAAGVRVDHPANKGRTGCKSDNTQF
jgi:hypothetical protein